MASYFIVLSSVFQHFHLYLVHSYEYETSVPSVDSSALNPSPCQVGSPANVSQNAVPAKGTCLHTLKCTYVDK